ncbi:MAG TPA: TonB-dependent receptor [Candidatus Methylacidiphilales bacterium]|jgi:iron complex outermembrane receptor protein|nr:TonB-dependent receptor [Candidatus Methylacidiphilales bacterium]
MKILFRLKKGLGHPLAIGGISFFVIIGPMDRARADDPASTSTNAPANTPPGATTKPGTSAVANSPAGVPPTTANVKPGASTSTATARLPAANPDNQPIGGLSIDDLLNVTVTSAGDKEQKLSDVAAAMTVITSDDIERSGATNIPDLLRYVPGVEVGRASNTDVSVTVRGLGGVDASSLLVLVDGRSIYNPVFGGVDWQFERMMMDNIDRIEVIRGPGATIWGANAVNGVINIITKDSADTQGGLVSAIYGTKEDGTGSFRYGLTPTQGLTLRLYGQYENIAASSPLPGNQKFDDGHTDTGGFRADYRPDSDDHFRLSSDVLTTHAGDAEFFPASFGGGLWPPTFNQTYDDENVNFVWEHNFEPDNQFTVQSYYDRSAQNTDPADLFGTGTLNTVDVQARHSLPLHLLPIKQELTYGIEYREVSSELTSTRVIGWSPLDRNDQTFSAFAQTDLHLIDNVLTLTMGSKLDHNDFTGFEVQPSARLLWTIDGRNSIWASASRAVREPDVLDFDAALTANGNPNLKSEVLKAYEFGYRVQPVEELSFDISFFYNDYNNLIETFLPPGSFVPSFEQFQKAQTYGVEPSFTAQVQPWWKLTGSYSLLKFHTDNSSVPAGYTYSGIPLETVDPASQFSLRSFFDLPNHVSIDVGGRFVDKIAGANGYFAADVRVAWKPTPSWEVSVVGQNLLDANHVENPNQFGNAVYIGPEVYGKVVFKF